MSESCYQEVVPDQTVPEEWKEFTLNTGGTQSILQDIKVPEKANGYSYKHATKHYTRNRFVYWRINNDVLELVEQSLDVNLTGNRVRFKFTDTPILNGITVHESHGSVVVLVPTVCSIHRLTFPHPDRLHKDALGPRPDLTAPSIFSDVTHASVGDPATFHVITHPGTALPNVAASALNVAQDEAVFALGYPAGELLLVRQAFSGSCLTCELKHDTIVPRFLSSIAGALRGKRDGHIVVSMTLQSFGLDMYMITLCRDGNLRVWSCAKAQQVAVHDILADSADTGRNLAQGAHNHMLRRSNDADLLLSVFLNFASESQFHVLQPAVVNGTFKFLRVCTLYSPEQDLVDFSVDSKRLWTVWRTVNGDFTVKSARVDGHNRSVWMPAVLNPPLDPEGMIADWDIDPKQAFVSYIFAPGRFPLSVITKALSIYKKSAALSDINVSAAVLKQRVCLAIEMEIQTEVKDYEISDDDYLETSTRCWLRFYSCCIQYHAASTRPLGILQLSSVSGAVLLKKSMYSLLRPLDVLEQMAHCPDSIDVDTFKSVPQLQSHETDACSDLAVLAEVLTALDAELGDDFKTTVDRDMLLLKPPDKLMSELVIDLMGASESPVVSTNFVWTLSQKLADCADLYVAMHALLEMLRLDGPEQADGAPRTASAERLFSSETGVSVVSQCLRQMASVRFGICRNLLLLQNILLERRELDWGILEAVRSVCMPDTVVFMQAYHVILWLCDQSAVHTLMPKSTCQRLGPLNLAPVFGLKNGKVASLLELFAGSKGGALAHEAFACADPDALPHWHHSLLSYVRHLGQSVWAVSGTVALCEWMLAAGQHLLLQQYVRLLRRWCDWNSCSRNFIAAAALLSAGQFHKAEALFLVSAKGIFTEGYLADRVPMPDDNEARALVNYYLKVIQLFELHGARDCAINVARAALNVAETEDAHVATLHSVMFVHHLALGHFDEAYSSLIANPDQGRQEDNLRDLVKTLLENKMLDRLMSYPYVDMTCAFTDIMTARARACDTIHNVFYDFLYSYEVKRGNMRLAATAMYEQAYRLGQHNTVESLERQVKCYLACVNALQLIGPSDRWVLRPVDQGEDEEVLLFPVPAGSCTPAIKHKTVRDVKAMDIEGVRKEFLLCQARLRLARYSPDTLANQFTSATELVTMLTNMGMFKHALVLCETFRVPADQVFEALSKTCVLLMRNDNPDAWNWLVENDLADLPLVDSSPATVCWHLLGSLLARHEGPGATELHRAVCQKLLWMGAHLPHWLVASYKRRNGSELLRLLVRSGRLSDAGALARDYLWAALGTGQEHFGLGHTLLTTKVPLCLPLNTIQLLLHELTLTSAADAKYEKECTSLAKLFEKYIETSMRVSSNMALAAST